MNDQSNKQNRIGALSHRNSLSRVSSVILFSVVIVASAFLAFPVSDIHADGPDQAYIIIQFSETDIIVRPISFTAPISGYAALTLTGLDLITTTFPGLGISSCAIEGVGDLNPNDNDGCFGNGFWNSQTWNGNDWEVYLTGPSNTSLADGAIELWEWQESFVPQSLPRSPAPFIAASAGLDWLKAQQAEDGSYSQNTSVSLDSMLAVLSNRNDAAAWQQGNGTSLFSYIFGQAVQFTQLSGNETGRADAAGKLLTAFAATDGCLPVGTKMPLDYYNSSTGVFEGQFGTGGGSQSWAILGTVAASQTVPAAAVHNLRDQIQMDGGWEWQTGFGTDTNATAIALQVLVAVGEPLTSSTILSGLTYLRSTQNVDGGFPFIAGGESDANSTAWTLQALWATQQDPYTATWAMNNTNAVSFLLSLQLADGSFAWQSGSGSNLLATQQAIPALLGTPLPLNITPPTPTGTAIFNVTSCPTTYLPLVLR